MKKFGKIVGISLGALVGILLIAVCALLWVVFTPERLTPIVRQAVDKVIACEYEISEVELTFFSTFPEFGLRADTLCLVNVCEGANEDTVLFAPHVLATVDVMALWKERHLNIHRLTLTDVEGYVYMSDSVSNVDVFVLSGDTVTETASDVSLPFDSITVGEFILTAKQLVLDDRKNEIDASLYNTGLQAYMNGWEDVSLSLSAADVCATIGGEVYANHLSVDVSLPLSIDMETQSLDMQQARVRVNEYELAVDGIVNMADSVSMQVNVQAEEWQIAPLLELLPRSLTTSLEGIDVDGKVSLNADIAGVYSESRLPIVDANVVLQQGRGSYASLPYVLRDVSVEADTHVDLNNESNTNIILHQLSAKTRSSSVTCRGRVDNVLTDMQLDVRVGVNAYVPDFAYFMPENMQVEGRLKGTLDAKASLEDLLEFRLDGMKLKANLYAQDFSYEQDSMQASSPAMRVRCELPNTTASSKNVDWASVRISTSGLQFSQTNTLYASLGVSDIVVEVNDVLSSETVQAVVDVQSNEFVQLKMDSIAVNVTSPQLKATLAVNMKDSVEIPTISAQLAYDSMLANYGDICGLMQASSLEVNLSSSKQNKSIPRLEAAVRTKALEANVDTTISVETQALAVRAVARYNAKADNILLRWNPRLDVVMEQGTVHMSSVAPPIVIPYIDFAYSNRECAINQSQLQIGQSDFSLSGNVRNIGAWLRGRDELQGELNFVSEYTDVNELMALFSAEQGSEETEVLTENTTEEYDSVVVTKGESEPFLVPMNMNLSLNTHIQEARVFEQNLRNLKGKLYVKDGILVLEEMGFVCNAAKLQLTAMYRTPRRNHIYVGLDYHMIDIHIEELVQMLPQLDTIVPMLKSFKGNAEFHLAAETYTNAQYKIKPSTLRGACSLTGKDLVVMDSETFSTISKKLLFNKKTENKVDSLSAEITVYKKEIDVYPLCVSMDNYMVALGGRHNLDMTFNYDVNVLSPIYLGVNVSGSIDDLDIKLTKCKYAKDFRPSAHGKVSQQTAELRNIIRESMRKNVKIE